MTLELRRMDRAANLNRMWREAAWTRARSQIAFAGQLATATPRHEAAWKKLVEQAQAVVIAGLADEAVDLSRLVTDVEKTLAPLAAAAKEQTLHLVGHAHIDMNWLWSWPETVAITLDTLRTMLDLLDEFPEFHFSQSQASVYAIIEKYEPALLPRIARYVKEGRWEVTASHWVEGEKNNVSGEALCRHVLYTRAYMMQLFGLRPEDVAIDWSPDTFGHAATLPAYLRQGGLRYLYLHRPGTQHQPVPEAFWWQGPDGSRVLVRNDQRRGYNGMIQPQSILETLATMRDSVGLDFAMLVYGVGDHGGGPTRRDLLAAREMNAWPVFPTLTFSSAQAFYRKLERAGADLPLICGELNYEFAGCYTTQALIKRVNRLAEARLADTEFAAVANRLVSGAPYPAAPLTEDWRRTLFSHFHDILPGSGVRDTRTYTHGLFQETAASTAVLTTRALRQVAAAVDTAATGCPDEKAVALPALFTGGGQGGGAGIHAGEGRVSLADRHGGSTVYPFVVFNSTTAERNEVVQLTLWDREVQGSPIPFHSKVFEATDASGHILALQTVAKGAEWGHLNQSLAVPVTVPALGYTTITVRESFAPPHAMRGVWLTRRTHHCSYSAVDRSVIGLENARVAIVFDCCTGNIVSFFDKTTNVERIDATMGGMGFEFSVERPHEMSAWLIGNSSVSETPILKQVEEVADGPYAAELVLTFGIRASTIRAHYVLHADESAVRVSLQIDWFERGDATIGVPNLRLALPTALQHVTARYEIPFGALERQASPDQEVPALRWAKISGASEHGDAAVVLFNDCKHGHAVNGATLRLNLIRSSYAPDNLPDVDRHVVRLMVLAAAADVSDAALSACAAAHEQPLLVIGTDVHRGRLPLQQSLLSVRGGGVSVCGLKWAESDEGVVVRLSTTSAEPIVATLSCAAILGVVCEAQPLDLMERPTGKAVGAVEGAVSVTLSANGLGTWLVRITAS